MTAADFIRATSRFAIGAMVHVPSLEIDEAEVKTFRVASGDAELIYGLRKPDGKHVSGVPESELRAGRKPGAIHG